MFDLKAFNQSEFQKKFDAQIEVLKKNERVTKALLAELSRDVLAQLHTNEDVRPVNSLLHVLTPVNRRAATEYFREFSGFAWDKENQVFTKKNKPTYGKARAKAEAFLSDEGNNIWTWAAESLTVERADFSLDSVRKSMESMLKKAAKNNFTPAQVLEAVFSAGFTAGDVAALMNKIADKAEAANDAQPEVEQKAA